MHTHAVTVTSRMNPAAVSGLLGALVSLNQTQAMPLVINLCKQAVRHVPRFSDEELTIVLGALMHFGHSDRFFVEAMERYVPTMTFTSHPETVTKVIQFFGRRNILSPTVCDAVAESFVYRADDYTTSQVTRQIMALGKLGYLPPNANDVFRKVETILYSRFSHFQPRSLLNLLHSCTMLERFPVNFVSKVFSSYFLQQLQDQGNGIDQIILAQLTQLYMTLKLECPFYEGPKLPSKVLCEVFPHVWTLSGDAGGRTSVQLCENRTGGSARGSLILWIQSSDTILLHTRLQSKGVIFVFDSVDVEIKLDEEGFVLPASQNDDIHKRIALCIDGYKRFTTNKRQLLGKEAMKQRHLKLLGYQVVQIPYYEFEKLRHKSSVVEYLHQKIFPHTFRLNWG
ncbi:FAST kinase domain-containing protein 3, mitochondrial [Larimichthys crocea]|uniref:Uncharacterized protein n=1 Tax=Larimichthys crocea TaxID=215358 RepID=A0ACD3QNV5_LARCR|nr:FAST kinase domain-containing protein 3, mitochondrial [Larimichthys crocea]